MVRLLRTHERFIKFNTSDAYISEFKKLIGHFEFGPNHKPFIYPNTMNNQFLNALSINYY